MLSTFSIPTSLTPSERLDRLRSIPAQTLVSRIFDLDIHTFRGVTDDAMLMEAVGATVRVVEGHPLAFKVTTPLDLTVADAVLAGATRPAPRSPKR